MNSKQIFIALFVVIAGIQALAFYSVFVPKSTGALSHFSSEIAVVFNENSTTITIGSSFKGSLNGFAFIIPVPETMKCEDLKTVDYEVFEKLRSYSKPTLYIIDDNMHCINSLLHIFEDNYYDRNKNQNKDSIHKRFNIKEPNKNDTIGAYEIKMLNIQESKALYKKLAQNGYKLSPETKKKLNDYIQDKMKFILIKINTITNDSNQLVKLRPFQITYNSENLIIPIDLNLQNKELVHDIVIYGISKKGQIESSNFQSKKVKMAYNIPEFLKDSFYDFYNLYFNKLSKDNKQTVFLEFAENLSDDPTSYRNLKGYKPDYVCFKELGVNWITFKNKDQEYFNNYKGDIVFTRLHFRSTSDNISQNIILKETINKETYYEKFTLMRTLYQYNKHCLENEKRAYNNQVIKKRQEEVRNLDSIFGYQPYQVENYLNEFTYKEPIQPKVIVGKPSPNNKSKGVEIDSNKSKN